MVVQLIFQITVRRTRMVSPYDVLRSHGTDLIGAPHDFVYDPIRLRSRCPLILHLDRQQSGYVSGDPDGMLSVKYDLT